MSRPRSGSPRYRRFPWDEPNFNPPKVGAELDGSPPERSRRSREEPEEHWTSFRDDMHHEAQRRSPHFPEDRQFGHQRLPSPEEFYRRRLSPHHSVASFDEERRHSPLQDGGGGGERRRGGFRELFQRYENRATLSQSPLRLARETLPATPRCHSDHQQRETGGGWRKGEQGRGQGRFRDLSPVVRMDDQRGGAGRERGRRPAQGPNRDRRREDSHQERNPPFKRQRGEMDDAAHLGYRDEEDFGEPRYSVDPPRDELGGGARRSAPLVVEHDHGVGGGLRWEQFGDRRDVDPDFDPDFNRQRSPRPAGVSQERFRAQGDRGDARGRHFQDSWRDSDYHEARRDPAPQGGPNPPRHGSRDAPANHRGRGAPHPPRGQSGRSVAPRIQPRPRPPSQGYQEPPQEEPRPGGRPFRGDVYEDPRDVEPDWAEEDGPQQWEPRRPGGLQRPPQRSHLDPKMPRQRERGWADQSGDHVAVVTEETLTIKVDMSRPAKNHSSLCTSSDRQLSLDLVNVGRQRLDFLPMLEHSGTYRESTSSTGTFAQEIITLVHQVKDQYFRDNGLTLNQRFSAPQKDEGSEELTLDERFSSNRGFSLNLNSLLDEDEPLFSRLEPLQPVRGPGDLRHDLERRRQERLEGVKVTISGSSMSQRPLGPSSESGFDYCDQDQASPMEDGGVSFWAEEPGRRREGHTGPRRGAPYAPQHRNTQPGNRLGPLRRQNHRSHPPGTEDRYTGSVGKESHLLLVNRRLLISTS
uniref:uncharacterized protein zgc:112982 isoform X1 n=1 Tax=Gasterosteus aculeatus aculeatus TaxID=481459 RepID=UPI001A983DE9|nr:uncharacterized protein zgc:112982 isoform X1 [Gasterosteus aculeatus aculeatus]